MDCPRMDKAAKLLAKARSTDFDPEALALVKKSCRLLAEVVSAAGDGISPAGTERCPARERRAPPRSTLCTARGVRVDVARVYGQPAEDRRPAGSRHVDVAA